MTKQSESKLMGPIYGVPWIEVEFGQRDEGWALYVDLEDCIVGTKAASEKGAYSDGGGYLGPERPLHYYEIPLEGLDEEYRRKLEENGRAHTANRWTPKYKGPIRRIGQA